MLWKVKLKMLIEKVSSLFKKKKRTPRFPLPPYMQRKLTVQKPAKDRAIAVLLPFLHECWVVVWGDLTWLVNRRKKSDEIWKDAVERVMGYENKVK